MRYLVTSLLLVLLSTSAHAEVPYAKLRELGDRVTCQCSGGCSYTVGSCNMLNCHFRDPILQDIQAGLEAGQSEDAVLEAVYVKYGNVTRVEPQNEGFGMVGWIAPFASLLVGLAIIPWVVRRWRGAAISRSRSDSVPEEVVDRYRSQIEEDLDELE